MVNRNGFCHGLMKHTTEVFDPKVWPVYRNINRVGLEKISVHHAVVQPAGAGP